MNILNPLTFVFCAIHCKFILLHISLEHLLCYLSDFKPQITHKCDRKALTSLLIHAHEICNYENALTRTSLKPTIYSYEKIPYLILSPTFSNYEKPVLHILSVIREIRLDAIVKLRLKFFSFHL